ncbi:hypothetical protein SPRG_04746 [Saprolegnia parasitica CBS 223.65]|uniref:PAP/OAS1 substrate-binding-related domain-containing protein n=1 Tax=Saprolegnia parasitica (strain CBS 223.65) TaxID=695850 RepID=A0A067CNN2_SAPPC|nr:hypothetical protein SPRG_04746 [Saprolegnia parasitica CBS 223.65]KDO30845.1 hypothetical protein SPRG_04746 [Saprolegnia parasitica CBS 223.65]|eukprot:XP_012198542.1 hypothetical protein SPRG_04746 [Saprolegnia parasitica CBS 223.65]
MASTATSALEAQRRRLLAERDKMRSKAKPRATSSSSAPPPFLQPRTLSAGPPGLSIGDADDAPSVADLKLFVDHLSPATTPSHGMRPPSMALVDRAGHAFCFQRDAFVAWVLQYMHALPVSLAVKRSPPPILLNHLVRAQLVSDISDGWYSLRAPPTEVACSMPSKAVLAQQLLEMDVAKELARDISVVLQPPSTTDEAMRDDMPRLTFGLCITLRDTTWTIQRCIGQFARMYAKARESMDLPPFAGVRLEHARLVDVHDELNGILQRVVRASGPWAHADFTTFFDNSLGYLALLTNTKALHDRLDGSATTIAALTAQLKQLEATVGRQSTLIHTLSSSKPATATKSFSAFESGAFPSLLLPSNGDTYSSCAVWENTTNGLFSASRHSTHGPSTSMAACAATAACAWVPANTLPCAVDMRLGRIVSMLAPTPSAVCHRFKACNVVASMVKRVLGAQAFVTGVSAARMFLPDCQLKMSVFLPPPHSSSSSNTTPSDKPLWYMKLNEALCVASSSAPCADDLMIRNVELVHDTSAPKLRCCVGKVSVLIDYGAVHDVRNACFLEAMDRLIGKNHLFKRSVLLAQGWLVYESGTNVSITDYKLSALLSTHTVAVLMLYVFNLFHTSLHHPLQAVGRFFGTYSSFPWDDFCVSIDGPRDLSCLLKAPKPPCHARDLLLQPATLQEFRSCHLATTAPDDYDAEMQNKMLRFEVKSFNVMDPLDPASNLGGNVTAKEYVICWGIVEIFESN